MKKLLKGKENKTVEVCIKKSLKSFICTGETFLKFYRYPVNIPETLHIYENIPETLQRVYGKYS